ncbi:MAG: hypothetical protein E6K10_07225 [Methanobacteriota archaeon]|nr:MAG: hypothetical protein E6K10_07225 [Euryarchaeota archaeon]
MHLAGRLGLKNDDKYQAAYWKAFEEFFGAHNAPVVKAMLLARKDKVDTGNAEIDRVCFGLRQTMSWLAEAIERRAIASVGKESPRATPAKQGRRSTTSS